MTTGRKTALVLGGVVGLVLVALVALWKDLAVAYRISELRADPDLMTAWIPEPDRSVRRIALGRYVQTTHGIQALRRLCLAFAIDLIPAKHPEFLPGALRAGQIVQLGVYQVTTANAYLLADGPSTLALPILAEARARLESQMPLFELATPGEFELAEHPGVRFTVWSYREEGVDRPPVLEAQMVRHSPRPDRAPDSSSPGAAGTSRTDRPLPTAGTGRR